MDVCICDNCGGTGEIMSIIDHEKAVYELVSCSFCSGNGYASRSERPSPRMHLNRQQIIDAALRVMSNFRQ
jgi:hypothetical protein